MRQFEEKGKMGHAIFNSTTKTLNKKLNFLTSLATQSISKTLRTNPRLRPNKKCFCPESISQNVNYSVSFNFKGLKKSYTKVIERPNNYYMYFVFS